MTIKGNVSAYSLLLHPITSIGLKQSAKLGFFVVKITSYQRN